MVKVIKSILYFLFFMLALVYFVPKINIYYFLENKLQNHGVVISNEELKEKGFYLSAADANVSVKSIDIANVTKTDMKIYGLYNAVKLQGVRLSNISASFIPLSIEKIKIIHTVLDPLNIKAKATGEFGEADAEFNIVDRTLLIRLKPSIKMSKDYSKTLSNLKKSENGEYIYEKNI